MELDRKLHEEIREYCRLNGLKIGEYVNSLLRKAFNEDRYGTVPSIFLKSAKMEAPPDEMVEEEAVPEAERMETIERDEAPRPERSPDPVSGDGGDEVKRKKTIRRLK